MGTSVHPHADLVQWVDWWREPKVVARAEGTKPATTEERKTDPPPSKKRGRTTEDATDVSVSVFHSSDSAPEPVPTCEESASTAKARTKRRKAEGESALVRPKNLYTFFMQDYRNKLIAQQPDMKSKPSTERFAMIGKDLGKVWQQVPEEERQKYRRMAEDDKERYRKEKEALGIVDKSPAPSRRARRQPVRAADLSFGPPKDSSDSKETAGASEGEVAESPVSTGSRKSNHKKKAEKHSQFGIVLGNENSEKLIHKRIDRLFPHYYKQAMEKAAKGELSRFLDKFEETADKMQKGLAEIRHCHAAAVAAKSLSGSSTAAESPFAALPTVSSSSSSVALSSHSSSSFPVSSASSSSSSTSTSFPTSSSPLRAVRSRLSAVAVGVAAPARPPKTLTGKKILSLPLPLLPLPVAYATRSKQSVRKSVPPKLPH